MNREMMQALAADAEKLRAITGDDSHQVDFLIRCNKCDCVWIEDDLVAASDAEDGELSRPCPTCGTDHYLMDLEPKGDTP